MRRGSDRIALTVALTLTLAFLGSACGPVEPSAPNAQIGSVWALGDSQGAPSNDPARGPGWPNRLPGTVNNGAAAMEGAGWTVPSPYTSRTVPQQASFVAATDTIGRFVVMAGINDLKQNRTTAEMMAGVDALEAAAAAEGATVLYVGIVPVPAAATISNRNAARLAFNAALSARMGSRYIDCGPALATSTGWLQPGYSLSPTDLHLNSAGEQALADCIAARL